MKTMKNALLGMIVVFLFALAAAAQPRAAEEPAAQQSADEVQRSVQVVVNEASRKLAANENHLRAEAARDLDALCNKASRPGAEQERAAVCSAIAKAITTDTP